MKIYQVEELVGITKKNIRFYEYEGLLTPERNPENGYREYTLKDVHQLEKIKLLRKLSVPIEEIRLLQNGQVSFSECMEKQVVRLEQEQKNAALMMELCKKIGSEVGDIKELNAADYLEQMKNLEKEGTKFVDITKEDIKRKNKTAAVVAAISFCVLMLMEAGALIFMARKDSKVFALAFVSFVGIICAVAGTEARQIATKRMVDEAEKLGADAIVGVMYGSSAVMQGVAGAVAYGTAVKIK